MAVLASSHLRDVAALLQFQLFLASSLPDSKPNLTSLSGLPWTCLRLLPRLLLALVTVSGLALPGLCSFAACPAAPFCSGTQSREGLHKLTEQSPIYSTAAAYLKRCVCSNPWVKPVLMVLSAVCHQF